MKFQKINKLFFAFVLSFALILASCSEDSSNDPSVSESEVLIEYLEANGDFVNTAAPPIIKADAVYSAVKTSPDDIYIIDIRSAEDFGKGHIEGAVNVTVGDLLSHVESVGITGYDKVVIVCYSGQTASFSAAALRMLGHTNVYTMKWGMCSWNPDFAGSWPKNINNSRVTQMEYTVNEKPAAGSMPEINTGNSDGMAIAKARAEVIMTQGFDEAKISSDEVFANTDNYFIVNYWPMSLYESAGHIPGAYCYEPKTSLKSTAFLNTLPTDKPIVVYCYTGQTSASVAAFLRLMGYDAKSLLFGTNGMMYDKMVETSSPSWKDTEIHEYEYVD